MNTYGALLVPDSFYYERDFKLFIFDVNQADFTGAMVSTPRNLYK